MARLKPTADNRTEYLGQTGTIRSFFGRELVEPVARSRARPETLARRFLETNADHFALAGLTLARPVLRDGTKLRSVRLQQHHEGVPVWDREMVVAMETSTGAVVSATRNLDDALPALGAATLSAEAAMALASAKIAAHFTSLQFGACTLYVFRVPTSPPPPLPKGSSPTRDWMHAQGTGQPGSAHLAWQILLDTQGPAGNWMLFVDARTGALLSVRDRRSYATRKAYVYQPDPITSSGVATLNKDTDETTLNKERVEVDVVVADPAAGEKAKLDGTWVNAAEKEAPSFGQPTSSGDFKYGAKSREFLSVMGFYWIEALVGWLRSLGVSQFNSGVKKISVDAQGHDGDDNSHWVGSSAGGFIGLGEGGVPDAADAHVIVHEYGHALHDFLGSNQNGDSAGYEEGFNDFLAAAWLDRYNTRQYKRTEVFPWDNNASQQYADYRRLDLTDRFDDAGYSTLAWYKKGDVLATALWDIYQNVGGGSDNPDLRIAAADIVVRMYLEMLVVVADKVPAVDLANGLITADKALTGGIYRKVIWDAFRRRGLWSDFTPAGNVDLYIRDSAGDTGEHASPEVHWVSPDLWVRNNPPPTDPADPADPNVGEDPEAGHQAPILNQVNYLYVRVHNRGSLSASGYSVEAYHADPGTAMTWPTHFTSMGKVNPPGTIASKGQARVGPFLWTPKIAGHECLLAIARVASDPAIADALTGPVEHWKLVRFDNNVGQRNVEPVKAVVGGKWKGSFLIRGKSKTSKNSLSLDATRLPADTYIEVRVARGVVDKAARLEDLTVKELNSKWARLSLQGGKNGRVEDFDLAASAESGVTLDVDFSLSATHLQVYPIVATQIQDGQLAGRLTIEITAIKELDDYVFGNPASMELHVASCPFWSKLSPSHKRVFETPAEGLARGYNGCATCLPALNTG